MIIGFWGYYESIIRSGKIFHQHNLGAQEYAVMKYNKLYQYAKSKNIKIITIDNIDINKVDCFLFSDIPKEAIVNKVIKTNKKIFLIHEECEVVTGKKLLDSDFSPFENVFTWSDDLVSKSPKFIKINAHSYIENKEIPKNIDKKFFLTLIASNKKSTHPMELYTERLKVISWYEKNHPELFDLYGHAWDEYVFPLNNNSLRYFNSRWLRWIRKVVAPKRSSWKGRVAVKKDTLSKYKFSLAFDNAKGINGYILEKIFDVFFAGTVPIYYGAPNIDQHIPDNCYIDYTKFNSIDSLHKFLTNMDDECYMEYLLNIENFLQSEKVYKFSDEYFTKTVISHILKSQTGNQ